MNCQDFEKIVVALGHNQLLNAATCERSLIHTGACVRCAVRLGEERMLMIGVRAVVAEIARQEAPARLEAALLNAFRQHTMAETSPAILAMPGKTKRRSHRKLTALAAGVLLLIAALASIWVQPNWLKQREEHATSPAAPVTPEAPALPSMVKAPESKQQALQHPASTRSHRRAQHQKYGQSLSEVVTEFFPLLEGDDLNSLESGQIVRVELSGSALLAVGLPVDAPMAGEAIKADVVLGHDGQARAIRFVR